MGQPGRQDDGATETFTTTGVLHTTAADIDACCCPSRADGWGPLSRLERTEWDGRPLVFYSAEPGLAVAVAARGASLGMAPEHLVEGGTTRVPQGSGSSESWPPQRRIGVGLTEGAGRRRDRRLEPAWPVPTRSLAGTPGPAGP
jgi:hypothetical protein